MNFRDTTPRHVRKAVARIPICDCLFFQFTLNQYRFVRQHEVGQGP